MLYSLLQLITTQPHLLAEHVEAYAELVLAEIISMTAIWKRQVMLNYVAVFCMGVAAILAGVALMLWAVTPIENISAPWALVAPPIVSVIIATGCLIGARSKRTVNTGSNLRQQIKADMAMLLDMSAS